MSFENFLESLVEMAYYVCPDKAQCDRLNYLLDHFIIPLKNKKSKEIANSCIEIMLSDIEIPYAAMKLFVAVEPMIYKMYKHYYSYEKDTSLKDDELFNLGIKASLQLLVDFDPGLISK